MKRQWLVGLVGVTAAFTTGLVVLSGCGGGGGPITPPGGGGGPGISAQFLQLLPAAQANATYVGSPKCLSCHNDNYHANWSNTRHAQVGTGCEQCHGAGSVHVANRSSVPVVVTADILSMNFGSNNHLVDDPVVCGQCHGPIFDEFQNSRHSGIIDVVLEESHASAATGRTCMRCHSNALKTKLINGPWTQGLIAGTPVSTIQTAADTAITGTSDADILAMVDQTHQSANCVTCHDPHTKSGKLTSEGEDPQLRRSTSNIDQTPVLPGSPQKVTSNFDHVCGTCHNTRGGNPTDANIMKDSATARAPVHEGPEFNMLLGIGGTPGATSVASSHRDAPDQCVHCHMPNARHTFTVSLDTSCAPCHTATDAAARETAAQNEVLADLLGLRTRMENWAAGHFTTAPAGWTGPTKDLWNYYTLVSDDATQQGISKSIQSQIPLEIRQARLNYYFIILDRSLGIHNLPYVRNMVNFSNAQLDNVVGRAAIPPVSRAAALAIIQSEVKKGIKSAMMDGGYGMGRQ